MSNRQIKVVMAILLLSVVTPNIVWAKQPSMALTSLEQAVRLSNVANQTVAGKPFYQHNYRSAWMSASLSDRIRLAERIGTQGATRYAAERSLVEFLGVRGRGIPQGPDFVYLDPFSNRVRMIEAKGGFSQPKWTYGSRQGTNTNAIRSAKFVLESPKASRKQKIASALALRAAQKNRLETGVVTTHHVLGKPKDPRPGPWNRKDVSKEAVRIERELRRQSPATAKIFKEAGAIQRMTRLKYFAAKGMRGGQLIGRWVLPIAVGVEGLRAGMTYYDYASGRMSQRDLYRRSLGPAIFAMFTVGGGIVGGIPGTFLGVAMAVPARFVGDLMLNRYYQKFDEEQLQQVNTAVYGHYFKSALPEI